MRIHITYKSFICIKIITCSVWWDNVITKWSSKHKHGGEETETQQDCYAKHTKDDCGMGSDIFEAAGTRRMSCCPGLFPSYTA